jgi:23S rRNA (uracil1939-C5)-methyltransferase
MKKSAGERQFFPSVGIFDIAEEGRGVGRAEELVLFVEKAVPGDCVDVELLRKKKNFGEGRILRFVERSPRRTDPFCIHFGVCGGCKWQHITYESQLEFKQKSVIDVLQRVAKIDTSCSEPILASPQTRLYRNKLEFTFSNQRWLTREDMENEAVAGPALGFHVPLRFDKILEITTCHLQEDPSNAIRNEIRRFALDHGISFYDLRNHTGSLRNLIVRTSLSG